MADADDLVALGDDRRMRDALLWNFTVLGEAAGQVGEEVKSRFADVPWEQPLRLRNRIVHGYWSIDIEILSTTAIDPAPKLRHTAASGPRGARSRGQLR